MWFTNAYERGGTNKLSEKISLEKRGQLTGQLVQLSRERSLPGSTVSTMSTWSIISARLGLLPNNKKRRQKLTRNVLIPTQGCNDRRPISQHDAIIRIRREQPLQKRDRRIEHDGPFVARLDTHVDLVVVDEIGVHAFDEGRGCAVEVGVAQHGAEVV
jgi:hypothetical protein